jgi:biotin synthase-related radical SAM superfamily protein
MQTSILKLVYIQRNPTRFGQSRDHLQEFKIQTLGTLKAKNDISKLLEQVKKCKITITKTLIQKIQLDSS